ncbi:FliM/FliN family flagellar motor switch protein [Acinetobacter pittii]|uniref:FliM/FliN family flagellar motor switch protein n=1 Tax=Acinetobacter pittii TaxID=48296 RepID=UPI0018FF931A|nr:FliM/FliN family flagellar motor C-terminal domain-containing protein [Acinetobacter pittii]MBJ8480699.1 FliM/FliN family flagellar motor switch protein [Acinetobacter pittii]MCU4342109.1 FliM/FliN family flagellar motor C-terminal domain-containing protein [Acinetobacter pittii]MCU4561366.1 FliM/FliN family flagellar motor C-terminal domain-containing protein [Acinetobacter pittii]
MTTQINDISLPSLDGQNSDSSKDLLENKLSIVDHVEVELVVEVGSVKLTVSDLFNLKQGSIVKLDQSVEEPLKLYLKDRLIAHGKLVAVDDVLGFQVTEVINSL